MIVSSQAGLGQAPRLRIIEHAERTANFHAQPRHSAHHFKNIFKILALLHLPPRCAHAETRCAFAAGALGKFHDLIHRKQRRRAKLLSNSARSAGNTRNLPGTRLFSRREGGKIVRERDRGILGAPAGP